jgi:hypothetical protein
VSSRRVVLWGNSSRMVTFLFFTTILTSASLALFSDIRLPAMCVPLPNLLVSCLAGCSQRSSLYGSVSFPCRLQSANLLRSQELEKGFQVEPCLFENVSQGRTLNQAMSWYRDFQQFIFHSFLEAQVTSPLAYDGPAVPLQGSHDPVVRQAGNLAHSSISSTRARSDGTKSSSVGSR